jgi:hypothetical protein
MKKIIGILAAIILFYLVGTFVRINFFYPTSPNPLPPVPQRNEDFSDITAIIIDYGNSPYSLRYRSVCFLINSAADVERLRVLLESGGDEGDLSGVFFVNMLNGTTVRRRLSSGNLSDEQRDAVRSFMADEHRGYQYTFFQFQNSFERTNDRITRDGQFIFFPHESVAHETASDRYELRVIFAAEQSPEDITNFRNRHSLFD